MKIKLVRDDLCRVFCRKVLAISLLLALSTFVPATSLAGDPTLLLHNSNITGSTKWGGDWGVNGGSQYGEFTCVTCHDRNTANIKRIKETITAPSGSFPGGSVTFLSAENGTSDFGDDSSIHATSTKVCEVCHSATAYHNYNQGATTAHYNNSDCIACHKHNDGFKASCAACHGGGTSGSFGTNYWPDNWAGNPNAENDTPGRHKEHMDALSSLKFGYNSTVLLDQSDHHAKQIDLCGYCHVNPGSGAAHDDTNTDTAFANAWDKASDADGSIVGGNCSNINCHNGKATGTGAGTYGWTNDLTSDCAMCHNDVTSSGNNTGVTHLAHTSGGFGVTIDCASCHDGATDWGTNTKPGTDHISGTLEVGGTVTLTYDGALPLASSFGSCGTNDCHNDGKNTAPRTAGYTWGTAITGCAACHGDDAATLAEGHDAHLGAGTTFGVTIDCSDCHGASAETQGSHIDQNVTLSGLTYTGDTAITGSTYGSCGTNVCHEDATGGAPANTTYAWSDVGLADCTICHSNAPTSGAHDAHIAATAYGPNPSGSTDCGECHAANANNTSMGGFASHLDGTVSFTGGVALASSSACDSCHGGATPAGTAKSNWALATSVTCESCHGGGDAPAVIASTTAPTRTTNYNSAGHGQGGIAKTCSECHDSTVAHISGALNDANRIKTIATKNYDTGGQENDWCNGCHAAAMPIHYANSLTAGGNSSDGVYCYQCHDPHGNSGYDAMVAATVNGNSIAAFGDRTVRANYANASFDGVCQACHELENASQVDYFNRSENEAHYAGNCISCHQHDDTEAFKPSGCNGCHGDAGAGNYWPDGVAYPDRNALHVTHVDPIAQRVAGVDDPTWAAMAAADKLNHKNNTCDYCHPDPGGTNATGGSHDANTTGSPANVADLHKDGWNPSTSYKTMQGATDSDGVYSLTTKRCSTVDCHSNGEFTWTWYDDTIAPGTISDLAAVTGSEPGTVDLSWTAPYNDGAEGPNAYHYRIRYRTGATVTDVNWASSSDAGGPPTVTRRGNTNTMTVYGLTPGTTYYFGVQTADEDYNWSATSNSPNAAARADDLAPVFWGLTTAAADDESGVIDLAWDEAKDHSLPITYKVWYNTATINFDAPPQATTQGRNFRVTGLPIGVLYNFGVRATDSAGKTDVNIITKAALSRNPPQLAKSMVSYYTNGATALQTSSYGAAGSGAPPRTWEGPAYAAETNVVGTTFYVMLGNGSETTGGEATVDFGYTTGGSWTTTFGTAVKGVEPNSGGGKLVRFAIGAGGKIPAGSKPAIRLTDTGGQAFTVYWGSAANRGDMDIQEQLYNHLPSAPVFNPVPSGSGLVTIDWDPCSDSDGHTIHYDVYGSHDGGNTWPHLIASDVPEGITSVVWDTIAAGIGLSDANNAVRVKVFASDDYMDGDNTTNHSETASVAWTVDNRTDSIAPAAITDLTAEERPKTGSIYLSWTAPGDDGNGIAPAYAYDIRYSIADITTDGQFTSASTTFGAPVPDFGGTRQGFEVLGLNPGTHYYFAIKTSDEAANTSDLSNSASANGGLKCGICHGTPPDDGATAGNHIAHGYTLNDCAKCHGPVTDYNNTKHQDGQLKFGFGRDASGNRLAPVTATVTGANSENIAYWQNGVKIYEDTNGAGGINETAWGGSDKQDTGTCAGFIGVNASGCHGPATPVWDEAATLVCADCHGDNSRTVDPYGNAFDDTTAAVKASPPTDNHGFTGGEAEKYKRRYVGAHEKHLNSSFRFAKGSSCNMCHKGNNHGDGVIDMNYDSGAGAGALWTPYDDGGTPANDTDDAFGTCGGTSDLSCHGVDLTPAWDSQIDIKCNSCHGFGGAAPDHVTDPGGTGFVDDGDGNCEWCHPGGHPRGAVAGTVLVPNNVTVGLYYASGGVHLTNNIGLRAAVTTEAEVCWGCHDDNGISEWGTNTDVNTGSSTYNYGSVTTTNWTTATWSSANTTLFDYKTGAIQSTHSTSPDGTSAVTFNDGVSPKRYDEMVDAVENIRCSNCHDVHNRNLADGDTVSGPPYLRGTWMGNPYPEDGAPHSSTTYSSYTYPTTNGYTVGTVGFGQVPRGSIDANEAGGFFVDENSGYPTKGWTLESSAGLCILCHGSDVNELDQQTDENLWLGTNGHSNAVLGGTGLYAENIFDYTHGRPTPQRPPILGDEDSNPSNRVANMGNQDMCAISGDTDFPIGYRNPVEGGGNFTPGVYSSGNKSIDCVAFNWGVSVDGTSKEIWYHQFSCSKCHNPHASRLPKLMITNCLDVRHNSWDDAKLSQTWNTNATAMATDGNKKAAYFNSAQNCHRRDSSRNTGSGEGNFKDALNGGWNHVTPW